MFQNPEQFANATKTLFEFQLETFNTLTSRAMQGVEQAVALNMSTARKALDEHVDAGRQVSAAASPQEALDVINARLQPGMAATNAYNQQLSALLTEMSTDFHKAADAHLAEAKSNLSALIYDVTKNVPPGSANAVEIVKTAIDNAFKGYEQVTQATRDAVKQFEHQVEKASAKSKKG
ncbi:TIGR01841 family phasin [Pseudoduganella sp. DS3]|uniref:TIGR01841 family phasin n=1 Tax=Pseudoduganella guangdongensis TaxID=2692179 RepID=A0A6N9HFA0_9BURK|nr:phasin family protein [Pseudoduganella guangdongensis]MYN02258.1 TIGR01841 family phasin [Pseudoduganella guangdongensis]